MTEHKELYVEIYVQDCPLQIECQKGYPDADVSMILTTCRECDSHWGDSLDVDDPDSLTIYCTYPQSSTPKVNNHGE